MPFVRGLGFGEGTKGGEGPTPRSRRVPDRSNRVAHLLGRLFAHAALPALARRGRGGVGAGLGRGRGGRDLHGRGLGHLLASVTDRAGLENARVPRAIERGVAAARQSTTPGSDARARRERERG